MADFTGGPGLLAFIATFSMVALTILLFRSLNKHLRKVRTNPPEGPEVTAVDGSTVADVDPGEVPMVGVDEPVIDDGDPKAN